MDKNVRLGSSLGYPSSHCVSSKGRSGGLLLLWKDYVKASVICDSVNFINCLVHSAGLVNDVPWQLTCVYGPSTPTLKPFFWEDLKCIRNSFEGAWMVTGDFNSCLDQKDKKGGKSVSSTSRGGFRDCVDVNDLIDIGFSGYAYTWTNRRIGKENIQKRLDRCFANGEWRVRFPNAFVNHLTALHLDHRPILINLSSPNPSQPRPFCFEGMWVRDYSAESVIRSAWMKGHSSPNSAHLMTKLKNTKLALKP